MLVLMLSYVILEESQTLRVLVTLFPICIGVSLIVYGASILNVVGFAWAFAANIFSASRVVFYKAKLKDPVASTLSFYFNVGFVSLCVYAPFYALQKLFTIIATDHTKASLGQSFQPNALKYLVCGSLFNFLYNLFSLRVLCNVAPISHSVMNITKRVVIVFGSTIVFNTQITFVQWFGMVCADIGVFWYSIMKIRNQPIKVSISKDKKSFFKKIVNTLVIIILVGSCFFGIRESNLYGKSMSVRVKCIEKIKGHLNID